MSPKPAMLPQREPVPSPSLEAEAEPLKFLKICVFKRGRQKSQGATKEKKSNRGLCRLLHN